MTIFRVAFESGNAAIPHAEDWATEAQAELRAAGLRAASHNRVVVYAVAGDGAARCWCKGHGPIELGESA